MRGLLLKLWRRRRLRQELDAELAFHREMSAAAGNPISLGNTEAIREQALDLWRFTSVENVWRDLVYAARGLRRSPSLVVSALLSLALGIGANAVVFSLGMEFLLSEPSVRDAASLVSLRLGGNSHSAQPLLDFVDQTGVFESVAGDNVEAFVNWNDGTETRRLFAVFTTKNYFSALGVPLAHGRGILASDPDEVAVLGHEFWRRRLQADPAVIGRAITLEGRPYTVVGVLSERHRTLLGFGLTPDVYLPRYLATTRLAITARLRPGTSIAQVQARLDTHARELDALMPEGPTAHTRFNVMPLAGFPRLRQQSQMLAVSLFFVLLLIVGGLVLLIACVNVAGLLLARAASRRREIAMRLALGASRGRLLQQLFVEGALLSLCGCGLGLLLARALAGLLGRVELPLPLPIRLQIEPDWRLALYATLLAALATLTVALLPAWQSLRQELARDLPRDARLRVRSVLVAGQLAVSVVVLATGLLFLRNLIESSTVSPGFDLQRTLRAEVYLPPDRYDDARRKARYVEEGLRALAALPGMQAVAAARGVPFTDVARRGARLRFPDTGEEQDVGFHWNAVTPDYFRAMGIPMTQGRGFEQPDETDRRVVVVNRPFVERYLGGRPPVGCVFLWGSGADAPNEIVGVAGVTKNFTLGEADQPQLYQLLSQIADTRPRIQFVMRSATPPIAQLGPVRRALLALEPAAGSEVATLQSSIGLAFLPSRVGALLLGSMGALGLLLACIGLYGVTVYSVERREREIGVRIAIGASPAQIGRLVLRDSARLLIVGATAGLGIAAFVTKPLAMFLVPGLRPTDPLTLTTLLLALMLSGLAASWGPLRRALAIDPISSLRSE